MPRIRISTKVLIVLILLFASALTTFILRAQAAAAQPLTLLSDQMSRAMKGTASDHAIAFRMPATVGLTASTDLIKITLPDGFTVGTTAVGDIDLLHGVASPAATDLALSAAADGSHWGASFTGQVLTLTHPTSGSELDIAGDDYVMIKIGKNAAGGSNQITNNASSGSSLLKIDVGPDATPTGTGQMALQIVDNDQVIIDGIVDPSITFTLSGNTSSFGIIPTNAVKNSTPNITLTVGTNGDNGYTVFVNDTGDTTNPGLFNSHANKLIASKAYGGGPTDLTAGVEGYGIHAQKAVASPGTPTIDTEYDTAVANKVGGLALTQKKLAYHDGAMTVNDQIEVTHYAAISSTTQAGSYFDTITYVASGRY